MKAQTIATRLPREEIKEIEVFAKGEDLDKSTFVKRLIHQALQEYKIQYAFKLYQERKISLGKAAEIAEVNLWLILDLMKRHNITLNYSIRDLKDDLKVG